MSNVDSARPQVPREWEALERSVRGLLEEHARVRRETAVAERRIAELEAALAQLRGGGPDPLALSNRVQELETENRALHARLDDAVDRVRRLLARTSFLEEER